MKETNRTTKIPLIWMVSVTLVLLLLLPGVFSLMNASSSIHSSGSIAYMSPLHVDGKYLKDVFGNIIYLRGCGIYQYANDPTGWWWPEGGVWYQGHLVWDEDAVRYHMQQMHNWGINCVRFHTSAEWWIQDIIDLEPLGGEGTTSYRYNLKRTAAIAAEEGLYVIFDLWGVKSGWWYYTHDYSTSPVPYSPYLKYPEEEEIFPNGKQSFADYWASVAGELKIYSNVIFELYNEPNGWGYLEEIETFRNDWFEAMQMAIDAIRDTGAENLILCEWGMSTSPENTWEHFISPTLDWIEHANLEDTAGNLFYAGHMYRTYYSPQWYDAYIYDNCYTKMQQCKFEYAVNTLNVPVIVGEIGVNLWEDDVIILPSGLTALGQELQWARNVFNICNQWGIGYNAWDWTIVDQWHLVSSDGLPAPSAWGQVLIDAVMSGS